MIRLRPTLERPDQRSGFHIPRLIDHVKANRASYAADAVTIISAFIRAGRPQAEIPNWGSFEEWSSLIRQAIVWVGMPDPYSTVENIIADADPERTAFGMLVDNWLDIHNGNNELTTAAIAKHLNDVGDDSPSGSHAAREAALEFAEEKGKVDSRKLGYAFRRHDGQVFGDKMFAKVPQPGNAKRGATWTVHSLDRHHEKCGDRGDDGDVSGAPVKGGKSDAEKIHPFTGGVETSPQSPSSPQPKEIAHKDSDCGSTTRWWHHFSGDYYCLDCWPPTEPNNPNIVLDMCEDGK
jgi:hypothetical protein